MMKKEFWFEEIRKSIKRLKKGVAIGQLLAERESLNLYVDNLLRIMLTDAAISIETSVTTRPSFFRRLMMWFKALKQVF
jgi:hypothetical protein